MADASNSPVASHVAKQTVSAPAQERRKGLSRLAIFLPGMLVAATGVGAGDLLTASIGGSEAGLVILWAAAVGALLKWTLNEGIARWQLATGTTLLEGWITRLGSWIQWLFIPYFFLWTVMTGGAMISACGVAGAGLFPLGDPDTSRIIWGIVHSLAGLALVWIGGFPVFEKMMAVCIAAMFVGVLVTAVLLGPDWSAVLSGIFIPRVPSGGSSWVLGILGGVGGTVTLLAYGYWIRETDRQGESGVRICRLDLGVAYFLTALFGMAMVMIGSRIAVQGQGSQMAVQLADQLGQVLGPFGKWAFLWGFWGAVFSSLLGVWQSTPYLFADFVTLRRSARSGEPPSPRPRPHTGLPRLSDRHFDCPTRAAVGDGAPGPARLRRHGRSVHAVARAHAVDPQYAAAIRRRALPQRLADQRAAGHYARALRLHGIFAVDRQIGSVGMMERC